MIFRSRLFSPGQIVSPIARVGLLTAGLLATNCTTAVAAVPDDWTPAVDAVEPALPLANQADALQHTPAREESPAGSSDMAGHAGPVMGTFHLFDTAGSDPSGIPQAMQAHAWEPVAAVSDDSPNGDQDILLTGFGGLPDQPATYCPPEKSLPGVIQWMNEHHRHSGACWVGRAETILLWRSAPRSRPLVSAYDPTAGVGPTVLNADSMESPLAAGPRISLIRYDQLGRALEFSYLRAFNFRSQTATPPSAGAYTLLPDGIFGNTFPPPNPAIDGATANLGAGVQGMEFNGRKQWTQNISLLGGLRWVEWRESLGLNTSITDPTLGRIDDYYGMNTINSMYGLQIGADGRLLTPFSWLRIDGLVKAGYYYNIAVQNSSIQFGGQPPYADSLRADSTFPAFVGEVGLTGTIPLTSWLDFQLGYMALWLEGIAQPTNLLSEQSLTQINPPPPTGSISATGGTVLQGVTFGLQGRW